MEAEMKSLSVTGWVLRFAIAAALVLMACAQAEEPETSEEAATTQARTQAPSETAAKALAGQTEEKVSQSAEASDPSASVTGVPLDPDAEYGGVLRLGSSDTSSSIFLAWENCCIIGNPGGMPTTNGIVQWRSWGDRADYENGAYAQIKSDLALSWEQSSDGTAWTFRLPPDANWHDGQPVTCGDVKFMLDTNRFTSGGLKTSLKGVHLKAIDEVLCPDDKTVIIQLSHPKASLLEVLAFSQFQIYPKHVYENNLELLRTDPPIGSGPFTVVEYLPAEKVVLSRNDDYWNQPFPYLDRIEVQILARQAITSAFRIGRLHAPGSTGATSGGSANVLLNECDRCVVWPKVFAPALSTTIEVNDNLAPWNIQEVKDAISLGIDRQKWATVAYEDWHVPPRSGSFPPGTGWEMPYDIVKTIPGYNIDTPDENKQRARELLAQAGFQPGELTMPVNQVVWMQTVVPLFVEDMEAIGIVPDIQTVDNATNYEVLGAGDFAVALMSFGANNYTKEIGLSEHYSCGSSRNYSRYCNPEVDRLIHEMTIATDPEEQKRYGWEAGEIILRDHAKMTVTYSISQTFLHPDVRNWMPGPFAFGQGAFQKHETTWLSS
jgi:peptide/nickel transport system substrate-binding protein